MHETKAPVSKLTSHAIGHCNLIPEGNAISQLTIPAVYFSGALRRFYVCLLYFHSKVNCETRWWRNLHPCYNVLECFKKLWSATVAIALGASAAEELISKRASTLCMHCRKSRSRSKKQVARWSNEPQHCLSCSLEQGLGLGKAQ